VESLFQVAERLTEEFGRFGKLRVETAAAADGWSGLLARARELGKGDAILIHYVGYGYARRGAPLRVARDLVRWKAAVPGRVLLVHFHEVAAFGPPWRSSFWMRPLQVATARRLGRAADRSVTSLDRFAAVLRRDDLESSLRVLPIISTVGEPAEVVPLHQRTPQVVLLGSPAARARIWMEAKAELELAVDALGVKSVIEIGSSLNGPEMVSGARVSRVGELSDAQASRLLSESYAAFFDYPVEYLSKSSAFAAACSHAVLPICRSRREHSGLAEGEGERWVAAAELRGLDTEARDRIASAARTWYSGHSVRQHAEFWIGAFAG
jgi:hypothetical protein